MKLKLRILSVLLISVLLSLGGCDWGSSATPVLTPTPLYTTAVPGSATPTDTSYVPTPTEESSPRLPNTMPCTSRAGGSSASISAL